MKKILSIVSIITLSFNAFTIFLYSFNINKPYINNYIYNSINQDYFIKKQLKKMRRKAMIDFMKQKQQQITLKKEAVYEEQTSYCVFKKRWCGYWKLYVSCQDWKKASKIVKKFSLNGIKFAKLTKIIAMDLIPLFVMQNEILKASITIIVAIILKLIEEGLTILCLAIDNNENAKQVIIKFWMAIPFWISFRS